MACLQLRLALQKSSVTSTPFCSTIPLHHSSITKGIAYPIRILYVSHVPCDSASMRVSHEAFQVQSNAFPLLGQRQGTIAQM